MFRTACMLAVIGIGAMILTGCKDTGMDVSGDGSQVTVNHNGSLWVADIEKENWRKVSLEGGHASSPTWSPDGRYVLFSLHPNTEVTVVADKAAVSPAAEQSVSSKGQQETEHATLYDTKTATSTQLASDVGSPFAWSSDGSGFVAQQNDPDGSKIAWFSMDGAVLRAIPLPKQEWVSRLVWLPGSDDVAFIAMHIDSKRMRNSIFRTEGDHIRRLSDAADVVGLGSDTANGRLLWARSRSNQYGIRMSLFSYDPATTAVKPLDFPERLSFVHPPPDSSVTVESVLFSANAQRMALIVQAIPKSVPNDGTSHNHLACYSVETDASGARLIRETTDENLFPAWSKDGRRLVIMENGSESPRLFVYNYDGTGKRMTPFPSEPDETPTPQKYLGI